MNFLAALVRKPHFALAIALYVLIAAALSIPTVPVALYPSVARPAISVSCTYPGANAREVMNTVAGPIEEKVNGVEGMSRMTSTCSDTGSYSLTVTFHVGVDRDMALTKVQSKVQQALSLLPQEVKNTGVTVESGSTEELGLLTLRSANGKLTREQVVDYAYGVVNPAILRVPGVGSSTVKDNKVAMRIWLDAKKMASHGISSDEVVSAIKSQNVQASLGSVGASPTDAPECKVISLISKGRLDSAEDFERIVVRTEKGGGLVRLGDIARIGKGLQGYTYSALYDETPAVFIRIVQLPGVDVRKTMKAIKAELARLEPSFPADLTWDMTYDTTRYMDAVLRQTLTALAFAFLLAVFVAGLYLRSVRAVALTAFASLVPVAAAFAMLAVVGYFINLVSLYAFVVAVGIAVVFSAVMVRRIQEIVGEDRDPEFAAALAVTRHAPSFVAAALAIAAAMVPVAMVDGMQGVLYRQFSLVLGIAALVAGLTSLVIVPAFAARVLRRGTARTAVSGTGCPQLLTPFVSAVVLVSCGLAAWGIGANLPKEFIPSEDLGVVIVDCKTAEGTSMPVTADVMRRIYRKVRGTGGIEKSVTLLGESIVSGNGENNAKTYLILDDWAKRDRPVAEIVGEIKKAVAGIPDAKVYTICPPPMQGQGNQSGLTVLVQSMEDADPVRFANEMQRFLAALQRSPLAASANCGTVADVPHLRVHVDREKCELMKVPMLSLYTTLQHALGSVYVNDINLGTQVNRVTVMSDWEGRAAPDRVSELYVRSQTGDMVPVDTLVTFSEEIGVRDCYRCNQYLYATAQFIPKEGVASSEAIAEVRRISKEALPHGYIQDWSGLIYEQFQSRGDTGLLFGLSILAVYVVMMVLFGSGFMPLTRMLPTTAAILGAVLLHAVTGVPMSFYSQFAILLLSVICTAVSLLATDRDGFLGGAFPTLVLAVVAIPLVFAFGAGSAGSRSLGVALLGGFVFYSLAQGTCCQNGSTCYNVRMRKNLLVLLPLMCAVVLFGGCACSGREPVSTRYRTPGIIGGMGPSATCDLMQKIIDNTDAADDQHNIHLLVDQNTDVPDRTAAILRGGADPMPELIKSARRLEKAGADFLCMSCNTAHYFHERLSREVSIPILSMPAESAKELKRRGVRKVGLLATDGTIRTGVYHRFLKAEGIEVVVPDGENQATVMTLIYDCVKKNVPAKDYPAEAVARTIADLKAKGAEAYLLACTELPIAFERLGYKEGFLDPTLVLARAVVREAGAPLRGAAVVANASVVSPESQGVSSRAIQDWIEACETTSATNGFRDGYLHGFVIMRHGKVIAEGSWAPQDTLNEPHMLYSHSKSFTATAIGFLVDDGKLDIDERIADLFPGKMPAQPSDNLRQLRVRDLLTMNMGAEKTDAERDDIRGDWIRAILANEFQHAPGMAFRYDSAATHLLAAIVERKSVQKLMDFLGERLFRPLGMTSPWSTTSPEGVACGGWGMNMTTRDMAKFGQFLLQKGVWESKRLLSSEWIDLATARQTWSSEIVVASQTIGSGSDWAQGYGFQFWRCRHGAFRADGASGQLTVVFPKEDAVVSVNAGLGDMQRELDLIWQYLLPAFGDTVLPEDPSASSALAAKCATLALPFADPSCKPFLDMDKAVVERTSDGWVLVRDGRRLAVGAGKWVTTEWRFSDDLVEPLFEWCGTRKIAANGRLDEEGALLVSWQFLGGVAHGCFKVSNLKLKE